MRIRATPMYTDAKFKRIVLLLPLDQLACPKEKKNNGTSEIGSPASRGRSGSLIIKRQKIWAWPIPRNQSQATSKQTRGKISGIAFEG